MNLGWSKLTTHPVSAAEFNPFDSRVVAVATCANYGFYRSGRAGGQLLLVTRENLLSFDTWAAPYDLAFAPTVPMFVLVGFNDGQVVGYNLAPVISSFENVGAGHQPRKHVSLNGHNAEVSTVAWSKTDPVRAASCAWDSTVHIYDMDRCERTRKFTLMQNAMQNKAEIHDISFCPRDGRLLFAATARGNAELLDSRCNKDAGVVRVAHGCECLCVDWPFQRGDRVVLTGGVDGCVALWDIRSSRNHLTRTQTHSWGVSCLRCAPLQVAASEFEDIVYLSGSFDMTAKVSSFQSQLTHCKRRSYSSKSDSLVVQHSEFVRAASWSSSGLFIVTGGWDKLIKVYNCKQTTTGRRKSKL